MGKIGIIEIKLRYYIPEGENAREYLENVELPSGYVANSYKLIEIKEEE